VEIISILVPYMSSQRMEELAAPLAKSIHEVMKKKKLEWGKDIVFVISADAVHYGDEDWDGKNFAFYGADSSGYKKAIQHESEIMLSCMEGELKAERAVNFTKFTVEKKDYKEYKWTWCGRYSVPMGMLAAYDLSRLEKKSLMGQVLGYETSLSNKHIPVNDLGGMGITAPAKIRHWVGYPAVGFK
jgi:predicted class III extradiol MEMO1 family dioxygenase